ncbi:hypothetical protein [Paracoccus tegillarcae]|nr:hypothetical protein [Paracoccus tegillarcae]
MGARTRIEELVAEIGSAMVCAQIGVTPDFGQTALMSKAGCAP